MTSGLEQCFSTVCQALIDKDICKTHGTAYDPEATRPGTQTAASPMWSSKLRDSGSWHTCNKLGTYLYTLHSLENSGLKYSEKTKK